MKSLRALGTVWPVGPFEVVDEAAASPPGRRCRAVLGYSARRTGTRTGAAGGVEDRHVSHGVPEGSQEFRPLALGDDVLRKFLDVEVQRNEVVDLTQLRPQRKFGTDVGVAVVAGLRPLARSLWAGRSRRERRLFQPSPLGHIVDANRCSHQVVRRTAS